MSEPLLVPVRDAARLIGIGRDSAYQLVRSGRLRSVRLGKRILIARAECAAFVARESGGGDAMAHEAPGTTGTPDRATDQGS